MADSGFPAREELGPNAGLVDEMFRLYQEDPGGVSEGWRDFFADYRPRGEAPAPRTAAPPAATTPPAPSPAPVPVPVPWGQARLA